MKCDVQVTRYDNENIIISDFQRFKKSDIEFLAFSIKILKIYNSIHNKKKWQKWTDSSGKNEKFRIIKVIFDKITDRWENISRFVKR